MDLTTKLSTHFTLGEMLTTSHREIDNRPKEQVIIDRLKVVCNQFLEPIRTQFGPLIVSSGYRCPDLNKAIGGAKDSAHLYGCAADFEPFNQAFTVTDIVRWVVNQSGLQYDQVIDEGTTTSSWVHLGLLRPNHETKPRVQALVYRSGKYTDWIE